MADTVFSILEYIIARVAAFISMYYEHYISRWVGVRDYIVY